MMKQCKLCEIEKTEEEFVKHKRYPDGLYCYCKSCMRLKNKAYKPTPDAKKRRQEAKVKYRERNRRIIRVQDRERYANNPDKFREKAKVAQLKYYNTGKGKEKYKRQTALVQARYPEKLAARRKVYNAIKSGELERPEYCTICLKTCKPEAHHSDYMKPLVVIWACRTCHMMLHRRVEDSKRS